jgi:hypothetical protein
VDAADLRIGLESVVISQQEWEQLVDGKRFGVISTP